MCYYAQQRVEFEEQMATAGNGICWNDHYDRNDSDHIVVVVEIGKVYLWWSAQISRVVTIGLLWRDMAGMNMAEWMKLGDGVSWANESAATCFTDYASTWCHINCAFAPSEEGEWRTSGEGCHVQLESAVLIINNNCDRPGRRRCRSIYKSYKKQTRKKKSEPKARHCQSRSECINASEQCTCSYREAQNIEKIK